jgi:predicted esterase YcpF (UPF0227 family)
MTRRARPGGWPHAAAAHARGTDGPASSGERAAAIIYLHGFRSSPASAKAARLAAAVAALPAASRPSLAIPALPDRPSRAMQLIESLATDVDPARRLCFIGSSLGGYYATCAAERHGARAVLVNPAVRPDEDLRAHAGVQHNLYTGEAFEVTDAHFAELRALRVDRISRPERYLLLVQTGDDVLDYRDAVRFYRGAFQFVQGGGDHAFAGFDGMIDAILRFATAPGRFVQCA